MGIDGRHLTWLSFDDDFLKKLGTPRRLEARVRRAQPRRPADGASGRGIEFADHRPYTAGDDFRHIDWKASQRGRLLLRLFDEERDLPIYLMIDAGRSMAEAGKFDMAAHRRRGALLHRAVTSTS